jgi:hypothetical protein
MKTIVGYFILPLNSEMVLDRAGNFSRLRSHCGGGVSVLAGFCPQTPYMGMTSLAVTKYCCGLRLHRQSNIWIRYAMIAIHKPEEKFPRLMNGLCFFLGMDWDAPFSTKTVS